MGSFRSAIEKLQNFKLLPLRDPQHGRRDRLRQVVRHLQLPAHPANRGHKAIFAGTYTVTIPN
jgi:hypothetical protein